MRRSPKDSAARKKILAGNDPLAGGRQMARANLMERLLCFEALEERTLALREPRHGPGGESAGDVSPADQSLSPNNSYYSPQQMEAAL